MSADRTTTARFARLEDAGVLLGLSAGQVITLGLGLAVTVISEYTGGARGLVLSAPVWVVLGLVAVLPVAGRPVLEWLPLLVSWALRRGVHATSARTSITAASTLSLTVPGLDSHLRVVTSPAGIALVYDPAAGTLTAVLEVSGDGIVLTDAGELEHRLSGWERLLASLCQQPDILRAQLMARSVPTSATPLRRWYAEHASTDSPWATRVVAELLADADTNATRYQTVLSLTVRTGRRGTNAAGLTTVERHLTAVADSARGAGLCHEGWLTPCRLGPVLRTGFDPYSPGGLDQINSSAIVAGLALDEEWDQVRTDSAHHAVFWITAWPRSEVHPSFLQPLLLGSGIHRTLSLTLTPVPIGRAMREIRRAKVEHAANTAQRQRLGQLEDQTHQAQAEDLARREGELVAGHGDLRFVGLLTVSAPTASELSATCTAAEAAAAQSMCELRRLVGQQGQAFMAGALPLARATS